MVSPWQRIVAIIIVCIVQTVYANEKETGRPRDWQVIEFIAEQHPYIVALLRKDKKYICTGTVINKRTVLTSGSCIKHGPRYIAVGVAVLRKTLEKFHVYNVDYTKIHEDYVFHMKPAEPNATQTHSNVGLVYVTEPILEFFFEHADIGNYYASELKGKPLTAIGFGKLRGMNAIVLQKQAYHQTPCSNPKWYYCVCGFEYSTRIKTYEQQFGEGAPVFLGTQVVAVTTSPGGALALPVTDIKYNIFTVIGPYLGWINKGHLDSSIRLRAHSNGRVVQKKILPKYIYVSLIISKLLIL